MIAKSTIFLGAGLLLASIPALAANETPSVAPVSLRSAIVKCSGVTNILLTADAEQQDLPLQVVRQLGCGEVLSILADGGSYTAHVRTSDGHDGYVARIYLIETGTATPATAQGHISSATTVNGIVRWSAGAPGCEEFLSHGRHVESITANGVTVQVSIQDTGWKYRANIAISNQSAERIDVTPGIVTLDELQPSLRTLPATDITKVARTSTHQVLWTLADAVPSPSAVSAQARTESQAQRLAYRSSPALDYLNPQMTLASARPGAFDRTEPIDVQAIALKYASLSEGQTTTGVMWFAREASARELSMRVPVGDMVFDFAFAFKQKK